jgi:hypothetical protein
MMMELTPLQAEILKLLQERYCRLDCVLQSGIAVKREEIILFVAHDFPEYKCKKSEVEVNRALEALVKAGAVFVHDQYHYTVSDWAARIRRSFRSRCS